MPQLYTETLGTGRDLVLVHGWGMNSAIWRPVSESLAKKYRVTCIDLPGHGSSPDAALWPPEEAGNLLLAVAPERAIWLGWSLGGMLAASLASRFPERVDALIMVASNLRFIKADNWVHAMPRERLESFMRGLEDDPSATLKRFIALQFLGAPVGRSEVSRLQQEVSSRPASPGGLRQGLELLQQLDLRDTFGAIESPILGLFGRLDRLVPVQAAAEIGRFNPGMQVNVFAQAGHAPFVSHPSQFIKQVESFVGSR